MYLWRFGRIPDDDFDSIWEANKHYYVTHKAGANFDYSEAEWKEHLHMRITSSDTLCQIGYEVPDNYDYDENGYPNGDHIIMIKMWEKTNPIPGIHRPYIDNVLDKLAPDWRTDEGTWCVTDTYYKNDSNGNKDWMAATYPQRVQQEIRQLPICGVKRHMYLVKGKVQKAWVIKKENRDIFHAQGWRYVKDTYKDDNETLLWIITGNVGDWSNLNDWECFYRPDEEIT